MTNPTLQRIVMVCVVGGITLVPVATGQDADDPPMCELLVPSEVPPRFWANLLFEDTSVSFFTPNVAQAPDLGDVLEEPLDTPWLGWETIVGLCGEIERIVQCIEDAIGNGMDEAVVFCVFGVNPPPGVSVPALSAEYTYEVVVSEDAAVLGRYEFSERAH